MKVKVLMLTCAMAAVVSAATTWSVNGNEAVVDVPAGEESLLSVTIGDVNNLSGKTLVKTGGGMLINTNKFLANFAGNIEVRQGIFWVACDNDLGTKDGKTVVSNGASLFCMRPGYLGDSFSGRWKDEPIELAGHGDRVKTFGALYFNLSDGKYQSRFENLTLNGDTTICPGARLNINGTMNMNGYTLSTTNCFQLSSAGVINYNNFNVGQFEPYCTLINPGDVHIVGNMILNGSQWAFASEPYQTVTFQTHDNPSSGNVGEFQIQSLQSPGCLWNCVVERYGIKLDISAKDPIETFNSKIPVFTGDVTVNKELFVRTDHSIETYVDDDQNLIRPVQNVHFKGRLKGDGVLKLMYAWQYNTGNSRNSPVGASLWNNENSISGIEIYNRGSLYLCNTSVLPEGLTLKCNHAYEIAAAGDMTNKLINVSKVMCETAPVTHETYIRRGWTDFKWAKAIVAGFEKKGTGIANLGPSVVTGAVSVVAGTLKVAAPVANEGELFANYDYDLADVTIKNAGTLDLSGARNVIKKLNVSNGNEGKIVNGTAVIKELSVNGQKAIDASEAAVEFGTDCIVRLSGNVGKELVVLRAASITGLPKVVADKTDWYARINQVDNVQELSLKYDPGTVLILH